MPPSHPHPPASDHPGSQGRDYDQRPIIATWEVTQACRLTCDHCRADAQPDRHPNELTTTEGKRLIEQLTRFGESSPILVFSGGDPLERPDLFDLLAYANERGVPTAVTPAPTSALTTRVLDRLKRVGVRRIALSLDGATPDRHDTFRGEPGSFATARQAATYANRIGLPTQINTTVTTRTIHDLPGIATLVEDWGSVMWEVFFLVPIGRGAELAQVSPATADAVCGWLYRYQRDAPFRVITVEAPQYRRVAAELDRATGNPPVTVGTTGDANGFVFVSHTGEVYPSGFLPVSGGNVRKSDVVTVYRNAPLFQRLRNPDGFAEPCGSCEYRYVCGGSRARAYATTGNALGSDPLCPLVTHARGPDASVGNGS